MPPRAGALAVSPIAKTCGDPGFVERFVNADLIGAERPAALEDENGLAERGHFLGEIAGHADFLSRMMGSAVRTGSMDPVMSRAPR